MNVERRLPPLSPGWGLVAAVLRGGTLVAVASLAIGFGWALIGGTPAPVDQTVIELIVGGGPDALIGLGMVALTLVPVAALAAAALVFARAGERRAFLVAAGVLALLIGSLGASAILVALG